MPRDIQDRRTSPAPVEQDRLPDTLCSVAHYDPTDRPNGAKARLLEIAICCQRQGIPLVHVNTSDWSAYVLDAAGMLQRAPWRAPEITRRFNVKAVMVAWSWNFQRRDQILEALGFSVTRPLLIFDSIDFIPMRIQREYETTAMQGQTFNFSLDQDRSCVQAADVTVAVTDVEASALQHLGARATLTVGYAPRVGDGVRGAVLTSRADRAAAPRAGYFGSMNSANLYSVFRSANLARMSNRFASFTVFGNVCGYVDELRYMQDLFGPEWFAIKGAVDSPLDCYKEMDIAVHVLAFGSGIKIKNIEALCYGTPLITNAIGAEGIDVGRESGLWRAETLSEFCTSVDEILAARVDHERAAAQLRARFEHQVKRLTDLLKET